MGLQVLSQKIRDMAAIELGFMFGHVLLGALPTRYLLIECSASANVTVNIYSCAIEVYKDKALLDKIRTEVQSCKRADIISWISIRH